MSSQKVKILIVEDDILLSEQMAQFLLKKYEVVGIASSGEQALAMIKDNQPDLVLMDIELEGKLDGVETAEIIQQEMFIPIIYLSRLHGEKTLKRVKKTMPAAYLSKPFKNHDLKYAIENAIYSRQLHPRRKPDGEEVPLETYSVSLYENRLFYKNSTSSFNRLFVDDIFYIEFIDRKCHIVHKNGIEKIKLGMMEFFKGINDSSLLRIHRRFGININYVDHFANNIVVLKYPNPNDLNKTIKKELPLRLEYKKTLMLKLGIVK